jgi:parallel beta-helix repeat protein
LTKKLAFSQETLIKTLLQQKQPYINWRTDDMRKAAVVTLILISLLTLSAVRIQPIKAEYQGDITINADGNISPSTTPIQQTGNIYTLTSDMDGDIAVEANNIVLDGKGYTLFGEVSLAQVSNVTIKNFVIKETGEQLLGPTIGITLNKTCNVMVINNTITGIDSILAWNWGPYAAIYVVGGNSNTITQNNLMYNLNGIEFINSSYNLIVQNNITSKTNSHGGLYSTGIYFISASNNTIYHNNFVNNIYQTQVPNSINGWDDGYLGNYWSDYQTKYPNAAEIGDSGVYNIPYSIDAQNIDRYPLAQPFDSEFYAPKVPPKISILSPVNQVFNESSVPLFLTVDKQVNWIGYSLDGQDNVTITANTTMSGLTNGLHNVTVYAKDTFGNVGASETVSFSVEAPFPATLVVAPVASVVVIGAVLAIYFKKRKH